MKYLKVTWKHAQIDLPIEIWSELDVKRMETRKIEAFRDGTLGYASATDSRKQTRLGIEPLPTDAEISAQPEFSVHPLSASDFDRMWTVAVQKGRIKP